MATQPRQIHPEGATAVCYGKGGSVLVTAGVDNMIRIFKGLDDEDGQSIEQHSDPVTALCIKGNTLASASEDNTVALFDISKDEAKFDGLATRFSLPARHVCFNAAGSHIAAAGDESDIKVVCLMDKSAKVLRGHEGAIRSLTFDPEGELLASASTDGTLRVWSLKEGACIKDMSILPERDDSQLKIDWHPNGKFIAIPVGNRTTIYERDTWEMTFSFGGEEGHSQPVATANWSPNGEYLASVSVAGEIIVWETSSRQTLGRFKHKEGLPICSVSWNPSGNSILWADDHGKVSVWKDVVPEASQFAAPSGGDAVSAIETQKKELTNLFDDDEDEDVGLNKRKRLKKKKSAAKMDDSDDDDDDSAGKKAGGGGGGGGSSASSGKASSSSSSSPGGGKKTKKSASSKMEADDDDEDEYEQEQQYAPIKQVELQPAFQPASTPLDENRRILVWNNVGVITSREDEVSCAVDVEFHNVQKHKPIRMVDHFGFTMGALGERSFIMACPSRSPNGEDQRDNPSVLFCRNISHWATDETWQVFFEDEEVEAIAVGSGASGLIACATSKRYLRLFSTTGLVRHVIMLDGPVVTMACHEELMMVAYHFGLGTNGDQSMSCILIDLDTRKVKHKDRLPMQPAAELSWLGFSDDGLPAMMDSKEVVSVLLQDWDYTWTPVAELQQTKKNDGDKHWVVGLNESEAMVVVCKGGSAYPKVLPRPMVTSHPLKMPIVGATDTLSLEEKFLRSKINFEHLKRAEDLDSEDEEDEATMVHAQKQMDKFLLGCISRAVQAQKAGRALDLTTQLQLSQSIDTAIKLSVKAKLPMLAERMSLAKLAHVDKQRFDREQLAAERSAEYEARQFKTPSLLQIERRASNIDRERERGSASNNHGGGGGGGGGSMFGTPSTPFTPVDGRSSASGSALKQGQRPGAKRGIKRPAVTMIAETNNMDGDDDNSNDNDNDNNSNDSNNDAGAEAEQEMDQDGDDAEVDGDGGGIKATPKPSTASMFKKNPFASAAKKANPFARTAPKKNLGAPQISSNEKSKSPAKSGGGMFKLGQAKSKKGSDEPAKKKAKKKDPNAPKKPMSTYMQWLALERPTLKKDFPDMKASLLLKEAGARWQALDADAKKVWEEKYAEQTAAWRIALEAYETKGKSAKETAAAAPASPTSSVMDATPASPQAAVA